MRKSSGAGINLIFFVLALLLAGGLITIGAYTYFHKSDKNEPKPKLPAAASSENAETETPESTDIPSWSKTTEAPQTSEETSAPTAPYVSKLEYHAYNDKFSADTVLELTEADSGDLFHCYPSSTWTFADFSDSLTVGLANDKNGSSASFCVNSPDVTYTRSDIGFTARIEDGRKLIAESFGGECTELRIVSNNNKYAQVEFTSDAEKGTLEADLYSASFTNGLYVISGRYRLGSGEADLNIYLYVNCKSDDEQDYGFYLCSGTQGAPAEEE